jgi:hypothetical protein
MKRFKDRLMECANHNQHVLVSAEEFSLSDSRDLTTDVVNPLHELLNDMFDVHVILTYRPYLDWLLSFYKHEIRDNTEHWPESRINFIIY